jgi:endonuclease/exonuclease/phosphatase family metal-dependent hydrolase
LPALSLIRRLLIVSVGVLCLGADASPLPQPSAPPALSCLGDSRVQWANASPNPDRSQLQQWCASVGAPVVTLDPGQRDGAARRLTVLSWNVHVGGGQVPQLVEMLRSAGGHETGVVLLLQEMFRIGDAVPEWTARLLKVPGRIAPPRGTPEITQLAQQLGMAVAYVPSMRNGDTLIAAEREDRGSAILSTEPLTDISAIELPMLKQRRVVVMATVTPRGGHIPPLRVMATHLDTLGPRGAQAVALADYVKQLPQQPALVMGGDLNAIWGTRDQTVRTLSRVMKMERCGDARTHLLGRFDYIFSTLAESLPRSCETLEPKYGSDHRPLRLTIGS